MIFYDKVAEGKKNGIETPLAWNGKNVLRYELRFKNRLLKQFNTDSLTAKDLYNERFYIQAIDRWVDEYFNIKKNKLMNPKVKNLTCRTGDKYLLSALVAEVGHGRALEILKGFDGCYSTTKEAQRHKKAFQNLPGLNLNSKLIEELDAKVLKVKKNYR